ncbi:unnamed protein product [Trichobilharzia regenti]|nr:unnamed protein product [Trichobilharzia regenti]
MDLEEKAQDLADECRIGHDTAWRRRTSPFRYVGQNWAGAQTVEL